MPLSIGDLLGPYEILAPLRTFQREAEALASLDHLNITTTHGVEDRVRG